MELFDEFFASGMEESVSPFLKPSSRLWGKNLFLKASLASAFLLLVSYLTQGTLSHLFLLLTFFLVGIPALISSLEDLFSLQINIDILMTLAAFLSILIGSGKEGALLLVLFGLSGAMEESVTSKAKETISSLQKKAPTKALLMKEGKVMERSIKDIAPKERILVKAGEVIPLDGVVVEGSSTVNEAHMTGESTPLLKRVGDALLSGSLNLEGMLIVEVTKSASDSTLAHLIRLVTEAQKSRPKMQRWLDKISSKYALSIILLSFFLALLLPLLFSIPYLGYKGSLYRALSFLIAASPCALVIAIPIAYLSSISSLAKKGIMIKGGVILDDLAACKAIAFDKTGTLTEGDLSLTHIVRIRGKLSEEEALRYAYSIERGSTHPIAKGILNEGDKRGLEALPLEGFISHPGSGIEGVVAGKKCYLGNLEYIKEELPPQEGAHAYLALEDELFLFRFHDRVRNHLASLFHKLSKEYRLLMLTGDHLKSAQEVADTLGIKEVYADLKPDEKLQLIDSLAKKENLAMVGDGVNDAPSLARAHVGISMGKRGSRTAVDASDIILLHDNVQELDWLLKKAKMTRKIVRQNLILATLAIFLGTLPALLGAIPLWGAVLLHEGGTVIVGLNGLRLIRSNAGREKREESKAKRRGD